MSEVHVDKFKHFYNMRIDVDFEIFLIQSEIHVICSETSYLNL